jgi:hypothetical protein
VDTSSIDRLARVLTAALPAKPDKNTRRKGKYEGTLYQDDPDGATDFDLLTKREYRDLLKAYDHNTGGAIPEAEIPTLKQISALLGRLTEDENPSADFSVMGPLGERAVKFVSMNSTTYVGGEQKRRRVRGPATYTDWRPCFHTMRAGVLILDASPPGPLDSYKNTVKRLHMQFPEHWPLISYAEQTNRSEKWPVYRMEIEEEVKAAEAGHGAFPKYWDPQRPWASVFHRAATDRAYWADHVEKPIWSSQNDRRKAAEAAAQMHRGFLPPSALDGFDEMMGRTDDSVRGPYESRTPVQARSIPPPPWENHRRPQPREVPRQILDNTEPDTHAPPKRDASGRLSSMRIDGYDTRFCYKFNRGTDGIECPVPCPRALLHRCEICTSPKHPSKECPQTRKWGSGGDSTPDPASKAASKGKGKKGTKGKGKKDYWN